jgi:hypothetical protein
VRELTWRKSGGERTMYYRRMRTSLGCTLVIGALVVACSSAPNEAIEPEPTVVAIPADAAALPVDTTPPQTPVDAGPIESKIEVPPDAAPPPELIASKKWPFFTWDRAEAYVFNLQRFGPGATLFAYNDKGWNKNLVAKKDITNKLANEAIALLRKTQGEMMVSKCAFPRHAIVLFQGEHPVASINVCFECGDILIWPRYSKAANWDDRKSKMYPKLAKAYDRAFPKWTKLFEKKIGLPTDWTKIPKRQPR